MALSHGVWPRLRLQHGLGGRLKSGQQLNLARMGKTSEREIRGAASPGTSCQVHSRPAAGRSDFGVISLLAQCREQASPYGFVVASCVAVREVGREGAQQVVCTR